LEKGRGFILMIGSSLKVAGLKGSKYRDSIPPVGKRDQFFYRITV